jgi:hypothetical protein
MTIFKALAVAAIGASTTNAAQATAQENSVKTFTVKVPGANFYYEVQGSGPVLLMIPGGPTDAGVFAGVAST